MVFNWPWKGDTSAAAFEKTLSALAGKISRATAKNDKLRQNARRYKGLWTLWTILIYVLAALILTLVTGWQNWGLVETGAIGGGPLIIYLGRTILTSYYTYRITGLEKYLAALHKERDDTVEKLKAATNYNSTQQLLEKYGSVKPPVEEVSQKPQEKVNEQKNAGPTGQGRIHIAPPPTANIPRNRPPRHSQSPIQDSPVQLPPSQPVDEPPSTAEFAPNAFAPSQAAQYSAPSSAQSSWYDRLLDVLLGEDETQPKNRIVLICSQCRLVNGQAPPGTKRLEQIGKWRCSGCGGWNGVDEGSETRKLLEEVAEQQQVKEQSTGLPRGRAAPMESLRVPHMDGVDDDTDGGASSGIDAAEDTPPSRSTRSRTKGKKKN